MASTNTIYNVNRIFSSSNPVRGWDLPMETNLVNNNIFSKFIVVKLDENKMEIPVFLKNYVIKNIGDRRRRARLRRHVNTNDMFENLIIPLYDNFRTPVVKKTGDSIISYCFNTILDYRIIPFKIPDGSLFYGTKGLIMDKNYNVLLLATIDVLNANILSNQKVYVNPNVFVNKDIVSKTILSKLIPIFIENNQTNYPIKFIIEDKSDIICKPTKPSTYDFDEDINNFLEQNVSDIESLFEYDTLV